MHISHLAPSMVQSSDLSRRTRTLLLPFERAKRIDNVTHSDSSQAALCE
jgi:hypothetical protein